MVPASDGGDDGVRVLGPMEGLWLGIGLGELVASRQRRRQRSPGVSVLHPSATMGLDHGATSLRSVVCSSIARTAFSSGSRCCSTTAQMRWSAIGHSHGAGRADVRDAAPGDFGMRKLQLGRIWRDASETISSERSTARRSMRSPTRPSPVWATNERIKSISARKWLADRQRWLWPSVDGDELARDPGPELGRDVILDHNARLDGPGARSRADAHGSCQSRKTDGQEPA